MKLILATLAVLVGLILALSSREAARRDDNARRVAECQRQGGVPAYGEHEDTMTRCVR